jgi:hypothetical protein
MKATMTGAVKTLASQFILAAALALIVSGAARANDDDEDAKACSKATLRGVYTFTASGFNIAGGAAQPKAIVEVIRFYGDGTLTVLAATVSTNGMIMRPPPGGTGSYSVGADCTGTLQFGTSPMIAPAFDVFVGFKGAEIQMIQTGQPAALGLPVLQGKAERVSR